DMQHAKPRDDRDDRLGDSDRDELNEYYARMAVANEETNHDPNRETHQSSCEHMGGWTWPDSVLFRRGAEGWHQPGTAARRAPGHGRESGSTCRWCRCIHGC